MFVSTAYAQGAGAGGGGGGFEALLPLILIFVVFYFLLIRPQQKKMKQHRDTLSSIRRGDKVVTGGGIIGNVIKVDGDQELTVEIAKGVKVKVRRELVSTVLSKTEPASGAAPKAANEDKPQGGLLSRLLGTGAKPQTAANEPVEEAPEEPEEPAEEPADEPSDDSADDTDTSSDESASDKKAD
jgi:preprotein translocase subunit YajC